MKAIIQRVTAAKVTVGDELVSSIGRGLCVLVGISAEDNANDVDWMAKKLLNIRLFEDPSSGKRWTHSVLDQRLEVDKIKDGRFGAMMQVHIQNDGPVTLEIESPAQSQAELDKLKRANEHKAKSKKEQQGESQ